MLTRENNELICRVGPDTPMGKALRRYWLPVLQSSDLLSPDCDPFPLEISTCPTPTESTPTPSTITTMSMPIWFSTPVHASRSTIPISDLCGAAGRRGAGPGCPCPRHRGHGPVLCRQSKRRSLDVRCADQRLSVRPLPYLLSSRAADERGVVAIESEARPPRRRSLAQLGHDLRHGRHVGAPDRRNHFLQNRKWLKEGRFSGFHSFTHEDGAVVMSAGPIKDRTKEILAPADAAVARYYRMMIQLELPRFDGRVGA
jgi:hypothetical protein